MRVIIISSWDHYNKSSTIYVKVVVHFTRRVILVQVLHSSPQVDADQNDHWNWYN